MLVALTAPPAVRGLRDDWRAGSDRPASRKVIVEGREASAAAEAAAADAR